MTTTPPISTDIPTPDPLRETPPNDRFCDLVLNGGVASGVVYPWALVELARHYRFRSIGGNSVGAMAAALAAAAEYGRCHGKPGAFEVLRRAPLDLAEEDEHGDPKMLRLFQPSPSVRRPFELLLICVRHAESDNKSSQLIWPVLRLYGLTPWLTAALVSLATAMAYLTRGFGRVDLLCESNLIPCALNSEPTLLVLLLLGLGVLGCLVVAGLVLWRRLRADLRALAGNDYGLCSGRAQPVAGQPQREEALIEWLHRGIQRSAGRERNDPPLTFSDLWRAPRTGLAAADAGSPSANPSINLQMFSTNVTLGRPVRWPLLDRNTRLFFRPAEWRRLFPRTLLKAVVAASKPYVQDSESDPTLDPAHPRQFRLMRRLREIPAGDLPIAVAARMSLCFPVLFSCVPVYAIDYEAPRGERVLRRCLMSDGGLCTNFPIHLFDAAHPRWPTFGLMLSRRLAKYQDTAIWLPELHRDGRADNWQRDVPGAELEGGPTPARGLRGLLMAMVMTALDWSDNLTSRLPQVRNRVLRMALQPGEGQLNIAMPGKRILKMAHEYGTCGGQELVARFKADAGTPSVAWTEHLYVRALTQLRTLRKHLRGFERATVAAGYTLPLSIVVDRAASARPLRAENGRGHADPAGTQLTLRQADAVKAAVAAVAALERALDQPDATIGPYQPVPPPELKLRASI